MRSGMVALCLGILLTAYLPVLPHPLFIGLALVPLAGLLCRRERGSLRWLLILVLCFGLGVFWAVGWGRRALERVLPTELEGVDFWASGRVHSLPRSTGRAWRFEFDIERACLDLDPQSCDFELDFTGRRVLLNHYGDVSPKPGERWRLRLRLNQPHGSANPGAFDYEAWLFERRISARGYVRETVLNQQLGFSASANSLRYSLREEIRRLSADLESQGLILALSLGDRDGISTQQWDLFSLTGTNHLVVISGLHVGFVALLVYGLVSRLLRLPVPGVSSVLLRLPAQKIAALAAILAALGYAMLAGFALPTQRACVMVVVAMSGRLLARQFPVSLSYCTALTVILLMSPLAVTGAGFWLSFTAVGGLLLAFSGRSASSSIEPDGGAALLARGWKALGLPQWIAFVAMIVPLGYWMQQISLVSPLANILGIPLVSLAVVPLCLAGLMISPVSEGGAQLLFQGADGLLRALCRFLESLVSLSGAGGPEGEADASVVWQMAVSSGWAWTAAALACLLLLMPRGWPGRWLSGILLLPLLFPHNPRPAAGTAAVTVLDVGQGLAVVVETASHVLVYDTGPAYSETFDSGRGIIHPVLRRRGITKIDLLMISHGHSDHSGGLRSLLELMPVAQLLSGTDLPGGRDFPCHNGQSWQWDGVDFEVLHPPARSAKPREATLISGAKASSQEYEKYEKYEEDGGGLSVNNRSCVLRISSGNHRLLLPGDIEQAVEVRLASDRAPLLEASIVVAPHHGSATSSTAAFVARVDPEEVIYSAARRSRFGHPAAAVKARYQVASIREWNTAYSGALSFLLDGEGAAPEPRAYRTLSRRYWFLQQPADVVK